MHDGYSSLRAFAREHGVRLSAVQKAIKSGRVTDVLRNERGFVVGIHAVNAWDEWLRNTDQSEGVKSGMVYPTAGSSTHASTPLIDNAPAASLLGGGSQGASALPAAGSAVSLLVRPGAAVGAGNEYSENPPDRGHDSALPGASHNADVGMTAASQATAVATSAAPALDELPLDDQAGKKPGEPGFQEHRTKREKFLAEQAELDYLAKIGALVSVADVERETEEIFSQLKSNVFRIVPKKAAILAAETDPGRIERLLTDALSQAFHESSRALADAVAGGAEERAPVMP